MTFATSADAIVIIVHEPGAGRRCDDRHRPPRRA